MAYNLVYDPTHPNSNKRGYIYEHRQVASFALGRPLIEGEIVHHVDGDIANNNPDNLEVISQSDHCKQHQLELAEACSTESAKQKRIESLKRIKHQQGKRNSQYGTMWITNGTDNKKLKKNQQIPSGYYKGRC